MGVLARFGSLVSLEVGGLKSSLTDSIQLLELILDNLF